MAMPVAKVPGAAESPSASDVELGGVAARANPSTGGASSSRAAPPAEEIFEVSSGDDEPSREAPSRPVTEGEGSDDDEAAAGRREPRSKAAHGRPAGEPTGAPLKRKAEAPPEGSGARTTPSWRSPGMAWVDTRAKKAG